MAVREILLYPDERLARKAKRVDVIGREIEELVNDMQSTMYAHEGVGLAATQIGVDQRVIVIDLSAGREPGHFMALINPEVTSSSKEMECDEEGCLSVAGVREQVSRAKRIKLRAFDTQSKVVTIEAEDMLARAIQHELDHLDGRLFLDRLPFFKRFFARSRAKSNARKVRR